MEDVVVKWLEDGITALSLACTLLLCWWLVKALHWAKRPEPGGRVRATRFPRGTR